MTSKNTQFCIKSSTVTSGISERATFRIEGSNEGFAAEGFTRDLRFYADNTK